MPVLPAQMTAIAIRAPGGPDMLVLEERPLPRPGEGEVLVKVAAAGVNRCLLYTSPSPRDRQKSRMPSSA